MEYPIDIPTQFAPHIASATQTRCGQSRPYAPIINQFIIQTSSPDIPLSTVLEFAQSCCRKSPRSESEYSEAIRQAGNDFNAKMSIIASGRYHILRDDLIPTQFFYTVTEDYID